VPCLSQLLQLLVAKLPAARGPRELTCGTGVVNVMIATATALERGKNLAQGGLSDSTDGLSRELDIATLVRQIPLPFEFTFEFLKATQVVNRLTSKGASDCFFVDIFKARAGVVLAERFG
jgi:hypothetical protein